MISGLSPLDIGLPAKFSSWRPNQILALSREFPVITPDPSNPTSIIPSYFQSHSMPVGDGKSVFYIAKALLTAQRACILTSTKGLQNQLMGDFSPIGLCDIRGRNNYVCIDKECRNCEEGQHHRCPPLECDYERHREKMLQSPLVTTNYSYFTRSHRYGRGMGSFDLLILDEAHDAPDEVCAAMAIEVGYWEASKIGINLPREGDLDQWHDWATEALPIVSRNVEDLKLSMESEKEERGRPHISTIKEYRFWSAVLTKVNSILEASGEWAIERIGNGYRLEPIWASDYADAILFRNIPHIILVSATMVQKTIDLLGIPEDRNQFFEFPSSFPPHNSPIYNCCPHGISGRPLQLNLRSTNDDLVIWTSFMDNIIRRRLDRKGIIHSVSYDRSRFIRDNSEFGRHMIVPEKGSETAAAIRRFVLAPPGTILVSPSITTGLDFKYSLCEYNIIAKVPFLDTRGAVLSARQASDDEYAPYVTAQTIVQAAGRSTRAADDRSEVFILDANFSWFFRKYKHLFPFWFSRLLQKPTSMPEPPAPLNRVPDLSTLSLEADDTTLTSISNLPKGL